MKALYPSLHDHPSYNHAEHMATMRHYGYDHHTGRSASSVRTVSIRRRAGSRKTKRYGIKLTKAQMLALSRKVYREHFAVKSLSQLHDALGVVYP